MVNQKVFYIVCKGKLTGDFEKPGCCGAELVGGFSVVDFFFWTCFCTDVHTVFKGVGGFCFFVKRTPEFCASLCFEAASMLIVLAAASGSSTSWV